MLAFWFTVSLSTVNVPPLTVSAVCAPGWAVCGVVSAVDIISRYVASALNRHDALAGARSKRHFCCSKQCVAIDLKGRAIHHREVAASKGADNEVAIDGELR